ncbi:hypothetical protein [Pseudomonas putida]|uniref:hypothetical protein n=1 Tax=Pseudomonas putida TaxID=303 RepID=UPI0012BC694D|nr:hypothetical protein [Pseudomonas putida]
MIIELDESLSTLAVSGEEKKQLLLDKLELLAVAQREGNHIVFAELDVAESLIEVIGGGRKTIESLLKRLINQYPRLAALAYRVGRKVLVGDFAEGALHLDQGVIKCPVSIVDSNIVQKSYLLVENLTDADFYSWIARSVHLNGVSGLVELAFEAYQGGGDTTANAYSYLKKNTKRLCLCIVDSDVRAPSLKHGGTPDKVFISDKVDPSPRTYAHVIGACSIENLIPFSFFERAWSQDVNYVERLAIYRGHYRDRHWRYLQLKKHIKCFELHGQGVFAKYWGDALSEFAKGCENKSCASKQDCKHYQLHQLSGAPMSVALNEIHKGYGDVSELLPDIRQAWEDIANQIMDWCCAPAASAVA